jgi:16S rRNA (cytidine1402-2'-O)-methyltransferase
MGTLYIVGTPIGNLEDITRRAARVLGQVDLIAAEDTRVTRKLLSHLDIHVPLTSYHQHNWPAKLESLLDALAAGDVALVTDAGMPGISDPGSELIAKAAAASFRVEVVPGVSAVTAALAVSGLPGDRFLFLGFLPRRRKERCAQLESVAAWPHPLVVFEAPHRLGPTLGDILEVLGDRKISVSRELTKLHEEVFRGTVSGAIQHFEAPKGEFVLVVRGAADGAAGNGATVPDLNTIKQQLRELRGSGMKAKEAVALVTESSRLPKNIVYQLWLQMGNQS